MIKLLDKNVADKIAAGEVIERPVSIIKELMENSIDAGANSIVVDIKNGGKSYIRVTDNGEGISTEEAETAFLRHATGKISSLEDLNAINTLGFRGEALASISAVTRLKMITKREVDSEGSKLVINGGHVMTKEMTGAPNGTTFVIEDVFYNTPARKKFLKTDGAEGNKIIDFVSKFALSYPMISIKLINNNITVFATTGDGNYLNNINNVFPNKDYKNLMEVNYEENGIKVFGYVSNPGQTKTTKQGQIFFVNGRIVDSKVIDKGIKAGYKERIFSGYPICILFITVNSKTIDVNIHPNKKEIRFHDEKEVINAISKGITEVVFKQQSIHEFEMPRIREENVIDYEPMPEFKEILNTEQVDIKNVLKEKKSEIAENIIISAPINRPFEFNDLKIAGYILSTYIVVEDTDENTYFIDQHAAHERIFYEKLIGNYLSDEKLSQPILTPIVLETSNAMDGLRDEILNVINKMGFDIGEFGNNSYIIREIPGNMTLNEAENFVNTFIDNVIDGETMDNKVVIDKIITKSCKNAVKGNNKLSEMEQNELLDVLSKCINPFNCPHGRPTFIKLSKYDIEKAFHRR
ncbi:MAG TPA: DNA mismatch repair endonuclease MutL [Anaerovoracaceae bacterium]|nr:DNA mismatch repair endonuclease MutL [Anaerovoracaceae bacterium]